MTLNLRMILAAGQVTLLEVAHGMAYFFEVDVIEMSMPPLGSNYTDPWPTSLGQLRTCVGLRMLVCNLELSVGQKGGKGPTCLEDPTRAGAELLAA